MNRKKYTLISSEEIKENKDPDSYMFGGKKMWETRVGMLNGLFDTLFTILFISLLVAYAGFIINFIACAILAKEAIAALFVTCIIQIGSVSLVYAITRFIIKIIAHHLESTEIYYANMTINKEGKKDE